MSVIVVRMDLASLPTSACVTKGMKSPQKERATPFVTIPSASMVSARLLDCVSATTDMQWMSPLANVHQCVIPFVRMPSALLLIRVLASRDIPPLILPHASLCVIPIVSLANA